MKRGDENKGNRGIWSLWRLQLQQTLNSPTDRLTLPVFTKAYSPQCLLPNTTCLHFKKKLQGGPKREKKEILEFSDWDFKITIINTLKLLMENVDSLQKHISNISREKNILIKYQGEMVENKNTLTEMRNAIDKFISRL